jgi:hypothetical protein
MDQRDSSEKGGTMSLISLAIGALFGGLAVFCAFSLWFFAQIDSGALRRH